MERETAPGTPPPHPETRTAFNQPVQQEIGRIELERWPQGQSQPVRPEYLRIAQEHRLREDSCEADRLQAGDAERWRKLLRLAGTPANSSDAPVALFWDNDTMTATIRVGFPGSGYSRYSGESFAAALAEIPEPED